MKRLRSLIIWMEHPESRTKEWEATVAAAANEWKREKKVTTSSFYFLSPCLGQKPLGCSSGNSIKNLSLEWF